jgi:hypothetical protein
MTDLTKLMNAFMERMTMAPGVTEGQVLTVGPPPYRRLDCDGRALAYVSMCPPPTRQEIVQIDVLGLWKIACPPRLRLPTADSLGPLVLKNFDDLEEALEFLNQVISKTRAERARA